MRAVSYTRLSQDRGGLSTSISEQQKECNAEIERQGWTLVGQYTDNDVSASHGVRPAYSAMLKGLASIDVIVCWASDRLYRRPADLEHLLSLVEGGKLQIVALHSGNLDLSTPSGRATARTLVAWDRREVEELGARVSRSMQARKAEGKFLGGKRPFGYYVDSGKLAVHEAEAELIRNAATQILNGVSIGSIVKLWNERGTTTSGGKVWRHNHVRLILGRPLPGILTTRDTLRIGRILEANKGKSIRNKGRYLLTGLLVCGKCKGRMVGRPFSGIPTYLCNATGSVHLTARVEPVDAHVLAIASTMIRTKTDTVADPQAILVVQREEIESKMRELGRAYAEGDAFAQGQADVLRERLADIEARLAAEPADTEANAAQLEAIAEWSGAVGSAIHESMRSDLRAWLETLVENVTVNPGQRGKPFNPGRLVLQTREGVKIA